MRRILMKATDKKKTVLAATAITTLLSATAAIAAIKTVKKVSTEHDNFMKGENFEFTTILDGLVKDGTITQAQEDTIQIAITTAKEAHTSNNEFTGDENGEFTTVPSSSKTAFIRLKKTLFKVGSQRLRRPSQKMERVREERTVNL